MKKACECIIVALMLIMLVFTGCGKHTDTMYTQVDAQKAQAMMEDTTDYIILDVRTPEEYDNEHIKGAVNVPNESIGDDAIAELPDKKQQIFVYCRSGNRSKQASKKLVALGYENIVEFGGIKDWDGATETAR